MSKFIKIAATTVAAAAALTSLTACSSGADKAADDKGSVYYLSFKPEQDQIWQDVAKAYTEETGVEVKVVTAASGTYEQTLKSEVAKSDAPTLFQINGPVGLKNWIDYTADLSETDFYKNLLDPLPRRHQGREGLRRPLRRRRLRHHLQPEDHGQVLRPRRREGEVHGRNHQLRHPQGRRR